MTKPKKKRKVMKGWALVGHKYTEAYTDESVARSCCDCTVVPCTITYDLPITKKSKSSK